jgi:hypothetical protein
MKIDNQQEFGKLVSNSLKLIIGVSIAVSSFIGSVKKWLEMEE